MRLDMLLFKFFNQFIKKKKKIIQQGCIKLFKSDCNDKTLKKDFYFKNPKNPRGKKVLVLTKILSSTT